MIIFAFACGMVFAGTLSVYIHMEEMKLFKQEVAFRGHAEYILNKNTGKIEFKWNDSK